MMQPMYDLEILNDWIFYYKNCLTEPYKYINFLEELDNNEESYSNIEKWKDWKSKNNSEILYGKKKNIKKFLKTNNEKLDRKILYISNSITSAIYMCGKNYFFHFPQDKFTFEIDYNFFINKYFTNVVTGPRAGNSTNEKDYTFTALINLNDDYQNGEINFLNQNIKIKPEASSILIFPSSSSYIYELESVVGKEKYMAVGKFYVKPLIEV
jgi:hypothetical protein